MDLAEKQKHLFDEVIQLRVGVRFWLAVNNANTTRWFGGAEGLQGECAHALLTRLLIRIRRITDRPGRLYPTEVTLIRVLQEMRDAEDDDERRTHLDAGLAQARALAESTDVEHLRRIADKMIAHTNPAALLDVESRVDGLDAGQFNVSVLSRAIKAISEVYHRYVQPELLTTDATYSGDDPFWYQVKEEGLPVLDYPPSEAFSTPEDPGTYIPLDLEEWRAIGAHLPKPWPRNAAAVDARRWRRLPSGQRGIPELQERWGWDSLPEVAEILFGQEDDEQQ